MRVWPTACTEFRASDGAAYAILVGRSERVKEET
jgi:hypothetical protein